MTPDHDLLAEFADSRSESAFRALVDRHLDLVHSVARRVTLNDDLARDVAQAVFVKLATRPDSVPKGIKLLAWLHRTTRHKAIDLVRSENRRRRREQIAITRQQDEMDTSTDDLDWKELEPVIDKALSKLNEGDRALVIARYYQKRPHAETASALGISEDAARMRTKRALGKLRNALGKRGIATSTALLGSAVAANAVSPAPAALSATVCKAGLAAASSAGVGTTATALALLKANLATVAALAVGVPVVALQFAENKRLASDLQTLQIELQEKGAPAQPTALPSATKAGDKTLADILADPDPLGRLRGLLGYVDEVGNEAIPGVLVELRDNAPSWDPDAGIAARLLLTRWAKDDPGAAFAYVEGLDYRQGAGDAFVVLGALAAADPQRAVEWLADPSNRLSHLPGLPEKLAGTITREWVRQDAAAAFAWAKSAPDDWRNGALTGVIGTIAADPQQAVALALQVEPGQERGMLIDQIAESWARRSPQEAIAWASTLDRSESDRGLAGALEGWSWNDPVAAAQYVDSMPSNERRSRFVQTVTESWARQDPAAAAIWVATQPESDAKTYAMGHAVWNWTVADPQAASTWLLEQPDGRSRDNAIASLAKATFDTDPASATTWAASITDREHRRGALDAALTAWLARDRAAARAWLESTDSLAPSETAPYLTTP